MRMMSIRARLLVAAGILLTVFTSFTGWVLDSAFTASIQTSATEQLRLHVMSLLSLAEEQDNILVLPDNLQEPRFNQLQSGLYAAVFDQAGRVIWQSRSNLGGAELPFLMAGQGEERLSILPPSDQESLYAFSFGVVWEGANDSENHYVFSVYEAASKYQSAITAFRHRLSLWLGGLVLVLLATLSAVLYWGLLPLDRVARALDDIKAGRTARLEGRYPAEINGLVEGLNRLIDNERRQQDRYRHSLGDLAHSLKTPLAVIRGRLASVAETPITDELSEQVQRMDDIVSFQLKRAAATMSPTLSARVDIGVVAEKIAQAMEKVYRAKAPVIEFDIDPLARFPGAEENLYEMLGNLLDNAVKHCRQRVLVSAQLNESNTELSLLIDDDGDGIPPGLRTKVLERGVRADQQQAGQGIGLAVVQEMVNSYRGTVQLLESRLGGLMVVVRLPLV